ncbi:lipopolysaccharide-induced tumor necrosis factor-alpha factor homolog isoform X2 [Xenopus tropicalis]|uniref:Lipopolysaccharide-induced tumor necrosis factor-alpha factor homolog isoform X2 n=1 Tax=Xenopus tropicalis TaxID=8364 RepID=A0A8J0SPF3_XENTR|nr:lipopolysaccharide-induced tumor necrosis factor-alpha factor homolog isoform X2 [Xenopus tropicalis]|eukprot:XP_012826812.1 PREDICTED: lipopolysaccharide-induced tumor necrosis factor-alpha factor homolog isoform X2 [Xenopus tropicalis]
MADANIKKPYPTANNDAPPTEPQECARLEVIQPCPTNVQNVLLIGPLGNFMPIEFNLPYSVNMPNALPIPPGNFLPEINQPNPANMHNALAIVPMRNLMPVPMAPCSVSPVQGANNFREAPTFTTCSFCQSQVRTRTEYTIGSLTVILFLIIILFGCWFGCCLIPFFVQHCKDVNHFCPNCNRLIHRFRRLT